MGTNEGNYGNKQGRQDTKGTKHRNGAQKQWEVSVHFNILTKHKTHSSGFIMCVWAQPQCLTSSRVESFLYSVVCNL